MRDFAISIILTMLFFFGNATEQYEIMVSNNYPPFNFVNEKNEIDGFNVDILKAIADLYDIEIKIIAGNWNEINLRLQNGDISAIAGVHFPEAPDPNYTYSRSVIHTSHSLLYNSKYIKRISNESIRTLPEPIVVLWKNDVLIHYILSINPKTKFRFVSSYGELLNELDKKEVTCAFAQKIAGLYFAKQFDKDYIIAGNEEFLERNMGFKFSNKNQELAEIVNTGLEVIMSNGEYETIFDRWINEYESFHYDWRNYARLFIIAGIILASFILFLLVFNHILQTSVRNKTKDLQEQLAINTQITRELEKQKLKAEESDRMKSAFLANMSHEIRTPMNGILGFTDLLRSQSYSPDEQKKFIDIIKKSGDRMLATINNIIEISKIESGVEKLQITETNIEKIVNELYQFFVSEAEKKGLKLILEKNNTVTTSFFTDQYKVNSILTNLIKNALKFTPSGWVKIGYSVSENQADFYVADNGIGIEKDKQQSIFDYFVQADSSLSSKFEGSGLGLSISSQYTKMLDGKIWLDSAPGNGSTFFVTLPNHWSDKQKNNRVKEVKQNFSLPHDIKIMVAEDDEISFFYLKYLLEKFSKNIIRAKNGNEAIETLKNNPDIKLVLMDSKMPELNGLDAVKRIRSFNPDVFIIAQSAYAQNGYRHKTIEAGCNEYIEKPINKTRLYEIISKSGIN